VSIRVEAVTQRNFDDLPGFRLHPYSCKYCVYWESTGDLDDRVEKSEAEKIKREWFRKVFSGFGNSGLLLYLDDVAIGYTQYAPATLFPRLKEYAAPISLSNSVFLACLYLPRREMRGRGLGKLLLDSVTRNLKSRNYYTLATLAKKQEESSELGPVGFYLKQGFKVEMQKANYSMMLKEI
jgi:GNAT superfamily N-acetyltransferase